MKIARFRMMSAICFFIVSASLCGSAVMAHEHTRRAFVATRRAAEARDEKNATAVRDQPACWLTIDLVEAKTGRSLPGMVRITSVADGKAVKLDELIKRARNWYAMPPRAVVRLPQTKLKVETFHGLETELTLRDVDLTGKEKAALKLPLKRFYDAAAKGLRSGNTHLHLQRISRHQADRYLRIVSQADGLDLVFLSYLRRIPEEESYISNSYTIDDLNRLSKEGVLLSNGEEHRHNFSAFGEGYGHVMFLDIKKLIRPVSIGPGIMKEGTDGIPLQRGIKAAHRDGAAVIWCHNRLGLEDIPNWMTGVLDAQNIFDGSINDDYSDTFYRYLNIGMQVPFSTGTDWFIYDFSRVYVPVEKPLTSKRWLRSLGAGRSYITNGTFLEFQVGDSHAGDTIALERSGTLRITGRGSGRNDFQKIELVHNGDVVHHSRSKPSGGHFATEMNFSLEVDGPGWLALRIPPQNGDNELGQNLFAHTSPVYIELAGRKIFQKEIAQGLIAEMERNIITIQNMAKFDNDAQRQAVLNVHRGGIEILKKRLMNSGNNGAGSR